MNLREREEIGEDSSPPNSEAGKENGIRDPVCDVEPYRRYTPGEYELRCVKATIYRDPRFKCWKCRLDYQFLTDRQAVSGFFHLGSGPQPNAGRGSEYRRAWVIANGAAPAKRQKLSRFVFVGKIFKVRIDDTRKRYDGRDHPQAEVYSTVKELLSRMWP